MDRLFPLVYTLLSNSGCFYLVTVAENKPGMKKLVLPCSLLPSSHRLLTRPDVDRSDYNLRDVRERFFEKKLIRIYTQNE